MDISHDNAEPDEKGDHKISNTLWRDAVDNDNDKEIKTVNGFPVINTDGTLQTDVIERYPTDYAKDKYEEYHNMNSEGVHYARHKEYCEDFADSVKLYLKDKNSFQEEFPNRYRVLEALLND